MDLHAPNLALSCDQDACNLHNPGIAEPGESWSNSGQYLIDRVAYICLFPGCDACFDEGLLDAFNAHVEAHFAESPEVKKALVHDDAGVSALDTAGRAEDEAINPRGLQGQNVARSVAPAMNMTPNGNLSRAIPHTTKYHSNVVGRARSICSICNKTFSRRSDMERHAKKHQPTMRIYHCSVVGCEYEGSYRKDKLEAHVKNCH